MPEYLKGDLYVRRDAGLVEIESDADDDADFIEVSSSDGSDTIDPMFFEQEYVKLTRETAEQLHALDFSVPNDAGE